MQPLYWVVSGILVLAHGLFSPVFGADTAGPGRCPSSSLTVVIRIALIPLFVKQIKSSRSMQLLQPKVRELQKKYGHDREKLGQETMKLYKENNANPLASCLPLLLQMPIFLALFRVLDGGPGPNAATFVRGHWLEINPELVDSLNQATIFGARISDTFLKVPLRRRHHQRARRHRGADHRDDGDAVHHPAAADAQEHAAGGADRAVRAAAEDHAVRVPDDLRGRRHQLPGRRADLLVHLQPVDDGPAVLRDPPQPGARHAGVRGVGGAAQGAAEAARRRRSRTEGRARRERRQAADAGARRRTVATAAAAPPAGGAAAAAEADTVAAQALSRQARGRRTGGPGVDDRGKGRT